MIVKLADGEQIIREESFRRIFIFWAKDKYILTNKRIIYHCPTSLGFRLINFGYNDISFPLSSVSNVFFTPIVSIKRLILAVLGIPSAIFFLGFWIALLIGMTTYPGGPVWFWVFVALFFILVSILALLMALDGLFSFRFVQFKLQDNLGQYRFNTTGEYKRSDLSKLESMVSDICKYQGTTYLP